MLTLVKFYAHWCKPCTAFAPVVDALIEENPDILLTSVNIDSEPNLVAEYGVRSIPSLVLIRDGNILAAHTGSMTKSQLEAWINESRNI